jgi:hypothetical protein
MTYVTLEDMLFWGYVTLGVYCKRSILFVKFNYKDFPSLNMFKMGKSQMKNINNLIYDVDTVSV